MSLRDPNASTLIEGPDPDDARDDATRYGEPDQDTRVAAPSTVSGAPYLTGRRLLARYTVGELLGSGGMGSVYRATDELKRSGGEDAQIAIKVISIATLGGRMDALVHELSRSHRVSHPNILRVHDIHVDAGLAFITMELLDGETLRDRLECESGDGTIAPLSLVEVDHVARSLCDALSHCHEQGLVHADIKPANVFVCRDGTTKLLDLGIAQIVGARGTLRGYSALYASPEQMAGQPADPRDDLFSVACTLFECLTGEHPFGGVSARDARTAGHRVDVSKLPWRYRRVVASALQYEREARPDSARALWTRIDPAVRRRHLAAIALAVLVLLGMVGARILGQLAGEQEIPVTEDMQRVAQEWFEAAERSPDHDLARRSLLQAIQANPYHEPAVLALAGHVRQADYRNAASFSEIWKDLATAIEASPHSEALELLAREKIDELLAATNLLVLPRSELLSKHRAPLCVLSKVGYRSEELERLRSDLSISC